MDVPNLQVIKLTLQSKEHEEDLKVVLNSPDKVLSDDKDEHSEEEGVSDSEEHILTKFSRGCRLRLLEHILVLDEKEFTRKVKHFLDNGLSDIDDLMPKDESESYPEEELEKERLYYHELLEEVLDILQIDQHSTIFPLLNEYSKIPEEHRTRIYKGLKERVLSISKVLNSPDELFGDDVMPKDEDEELSDFLILLDEYCTIPTEGENDSTECKLTELPKEHCMIMIHNLLLLVDKEFKSQILNPPDELLSEDMHLPKGEHSEAGEAFLTFLRELTELPEEHLKRLLNYLSMERESTSNVLNSQDEQLSDNKPWFADWNPEEDEDSDYYPEDETPSVRKFLSRAVRLSRYVRTHNVFYRV
ncbi:hypothetical protein PHJA_002523800 [Phtheirospermum japonicum]|uniref:Uncharacterized protein n=1 Tax=Phtheirospermum japonicum TaxID=374723 RepID=A0A830CXP9_9LAMI|nr:hypothetical protein PHJA_002523800 [Phtheirospermum japonicum]